jgi:hypothetical protein
VRILNAVGSVAINGVNDVTITGASTFTIPVANSLSWTSGGTIQWSATTTNTAQWVSAWQYMVTAVQARAVATGKTNNVKWFWCANASDAPGIGPFMESFWPGNSYVDYVGYDNYNSLNGVYMTPLQTISGYTNGAQGNAYTRVVALGTAAQPVWIGELNCVDTGDAKDVGNLAAGHSKATFYTTMFSQDLATIPRLACINLFDAAGTRDTWPIDSSPAALTAFQNAFALLTGRITRVRSAFTRVTGRVTRVRSATSAPTGRVSHVRSSWSLTSNTANTVEPYDAVSLGVGTWTQTGGLPTVSTPNFAAPQVIGGTVLTFRENGGNVQTITVRPHTMFRLTGAGLTSVRERNL